MTRSQEEVIVEALELQHRQRGRLKKDLLRLEEGIDLKAAILNARLDRPESYRSDESEVDFAVSQYVIRNKRGDVLKRLDKSGNVIFVTDKASQIG